MTWTILCWIRVRLGRTVLSGSSFCISIPYRLCPVHEHAISPASAIDEDSKTSTKIVFLPGKSPSRASLAGTSIPRLSEGGERRYKRERIRGEQQGDLVPRPGEYHVEE